MVRLTLLISAATLFLLASTSSAEGLYPKDSSVLQVNARNYEKFIARSNQASIVEFYAPWCGHCKSLKPAYEKAAKALKDLAQVAAVNCDDENNKAFCGSMGVQGFPTLKIVKPSKKSGKPTVETYSGARTTQGIVDAVKAAIPNHVKRISDKGLDAWLKVNNESSKAVLFSEKGTTSALIKVLAADFLDNMPFAQIRDKETAAVGMFGIEEYPTLLVLPGGDQVPAKYEGEFKKSPMKAFLSTFVMPKADALPKQQKPMGTRAGEEKKEDATKSEETASSFSEVSSSHKSAEETQTETETTTIEKTMTLEDVSMPTESPNPIATPEDAPTPAAMPELYPPITTLTSQEELQAKCLGKKTSTCVLVFLPEASEEGHVLPQTANLALASLAELAHKHVQRGSKLFPFYAIPATNPGAITLRSTLGFDTTDRVEVVTLNGRRGWWRHYTADDYGFESMEAWVDAIRLGDGKKEKLPEGLLVQEQKPAADEHDEL